MSLAPLTIRTAPFGHPHHDRPLIYVNGVEVAWANGERDARLHALFLEEHPTLALAEAEAAREYAEENGWVDDPTRGWRA